jgi:Cys-tRNA(Pro) deacylase
VTGRERVLADASARGVDVEFVEGPAAGSLDEAAALLGLPTSRIVKTLVVKRHNDGFLFALVPGDRQLSWSKLRSVVGVNRLQLPQASVALEATGYERGTIVPLGSTTAWPVYADSRIEGRVALGAGEHGVSAIVSAAQLIAGLGATVADITD